MHQSISPGIPKRLAVTAALTALAASGLAWPAPAGATAAAEQPKTYIVQMAAEPVVAYEGDVAGLARTKPAQGEKISPRAAKVRDYVDHLKGRHDAALKKAGGKKIYDYVYSFGGFAARMTATEAAKMRTLPDVVTVTEDKKVSVATSSTPSFLGLDARKGLWEQLGGPDGKKNKDGAGENLVIGVIDSGIWADSASFTNPAPDGKAYGQLTSGFTGTCDQDSPDNSWNGSLCNGKIVGARHFNEGWGGDQGLKEFAPWEFASPRDYNGHGTHTSSTAAGNHDVTVTGPAAGFGKISGIAPRARIAVYKALYSTEDAATANGYNSDLVAAIDQAVADGVDVINYSVSGTNSDFLDPAEISFLAAADAGVFVSAAGGNDGPAVSTVAHPSPWITTVAAGTHNRTTEGSVQLGNGTTLTGASLAPAAVGPAPLIDASAAALPGADPAMVAQCWAARDNGGTAVLDPAKVKGKIVLCDRGVTPRVNKSVAVSEAGGVGAVLVNIADEETLNTDLTVIPSVHVANKDRQAIKDYAATSGATATIGKAVVKTDAAAPYTADFSSRGPLTAAGGDLLKPDVIAPGQDILAAFAPPGANGLEFNLSSGTSMAAPHIAGLAALLKDLHPDWSPMAIKSALMTTGTDVKDGPATDPSVIFSQGAGHANPNDAADPGLVYDSDIDDWIAFLCGSTHGVREEACEELKSDGHSFEASDMNVPSIAVGRLSGKQTVTRKVTNVGGSTATYTPSVIGLPGIKAEVSPSRLQLKKGETKSFTVTFTRTDAALNAYVGGYLTWNEKKKHSVRIPLVVRPVQESWAAAYGVAGGNDSGEIVALDPAGERVYVTGTSFAAGSGLFSPSMVTMAYDAATGVEVWRKTYVGPGKEYDEPFGMKVSPDGSKLFVVGASSGDGSSVDAVTIAYDSASGNELWTQRYTEEGAYSDHANDAVVSPDSKTVYVTGMVSPGPEDKNDYFTAAYDTATGEQKWRVLYDGKGASTDDARKIVLTADGSKLVITGQTAGPAGTGLTDWGTVAYDAATGQQLWDANVNGDENGLDIPSALAVTADDKAVVVTGVTSNPDSLTDFETVAYDIATGQQLWKDRYDGPSHESDTPHDITVAPGGTVYVTGNTTGEGTGGDYTTIAYNPATGERLWLQRFDGAAHNEDYAWHVRVTPDGAKVVVAGQSTDVADRGADYVTIAYDAVTGEPVWTGRYDGEVASSDVANGLAVDATEKDGVRVFVTGSSGTGGTPPDFTEMDAVTVAYFHPWS
ncbi:Outer membrane protein assembly factor BamB, contains PQQ-like beta-propeller repeat [Nonomuraea maritima]|uniref:Outer membrane protein assembly factor BamB, contains PQQ-like beta-propeller repeat n=1 Tax=Nonomuraea maritima TaxID=683260 RepID=A0A1G9GNN2_9ACTN|nr:S8 family serine peptidase [Nonomuraea maritima]SDL02299.1 Outer membrane protein assembly factor BamB, contains PQQ-like beta-propeller repeat [Nonomuraea maritima]